MQAHLFNPERNTSDRQWAGICEAFWGTVLNVRAAIIPILLFGLLTSAGQESHCIGAIKNIPFQKQHVPANIRPHIPRGAFVRLVLPLSDSDTLTVYELGKRNADGSEGTDDP